MCFIIPVRDAREDLGLHVLVDVGPRLGVLRRLLWQQFSQISRLHGGHDPAILDRVIVFDDLRDGEKRVSESFLVFTGCVVSGN